LVVKSVIFSFNRELSAVEKAQLRRVDHIESCVMWSLLFLHKSSPLVSERA